MINSIQIFEKWRKKIRFKILLSILIPIFLSLLTAILGADKDLWGNISAILFFLWVIIAMKLNSNLNKL